MRTRIGSSLTALVLIMSAWTTLGRAQSSLEICSITIWNPDGPNNSAKCYALNDGGTTDFDHLIAHAINTTEGTATKLELNMVNPDPEYCPVGRGHIKCMASGNFIDWTEFTQDTVVFYDHPTIPVLMLSCSCF